jgi:S1-C subfamily serine protease
MNRILILAACSVLLLGGYTVKRERTLLQRIERLEHEPRARPAQVEQLSEELELVKSEVSGELRSNVEHVERSLAERIEDALVDTRERTDERIAELEALVRSADEALATHAGRLSSWEDAWADREPAEAADLSALSDQLEQRWLALDEIARGAAASAEEDRRRLSEIDERIDPLTRPRDLDGMWDQLVGPVVQLAGETTVGSGVLLASVPGQATGTWDTHLLTSWHVVRDIYEHPDETDQAIPVKLYRPDGTYRNESAHLLARDVRLDIALLKLDATDPVPYGARLAPRERLEHLRIFDRVYAVGCPLGNDPIPTLGEVASVHHTVEGEPYWMISAPTYIGNSGGGIFDAETRELVGIFSKIYTHGSMRSTIVPHMGLATPLPKVYDWLASEGYAALEPTDTSAEPRLAAAAAQVDASSGSVAAPLRKGR